MAPRLPPAGGRGKEKDEGRRPVTRRRPLRSAGYGPRPAVPEVSPMPLACPMCVADAPASVVWALLDTARLDEWWDARTRSVVPPGPLAVGQRIEAVAGPLG